MNQMSEAQVEEAMKTCAEEPIHIPGSIQPMGCLVAFDRATGTISHVSVNTQEFLGLPPDQILGTDARRQFESSVWHELTNAMGRFGSAGHASHVGRFMLEGQALDLTAFPSDNRFVVEFEPIGQATGSDKDPLADLEFFVREFRSSPDISSLLERMTRLMRQVSGYDRVMVYKFDKDFNGEIVAESKRPSVESFLGLHFPNTDIPAQARAMMKKIPLRLIHDTGQEPVRILSLDPKGTASRHLSWATARHIAALLPVPSQHGCALDDDALRCGRGSVVGNRCVSPHQSKDSATTVASNSNGGASTIRRPDRTS